LARERWEQVGRSGRTNYHEEELMPAIILAPVRSILVPAALVISVVISLVIAPVATAQDDAHDDNGGAITLILTQQQRQENGIVVARAGSRSLKGRHIAPGEVVVNAYSSSQVTPRIASHVLARHVVISEKVSKGQPLARLSSVEMAEAQGELIIAANEWRRVEQLGRDAVSGRRYTEARVAVQEATARAQAYGMTRSQVQELLAGNDVSQTTGAYDVLSPQDGTVISDDFVVGERVEPGQVLFELTDESRLWIEARLAAGNAREISQETPVRFSTDSVHWKSGKVLQIHHSHDEQTRTRIVRVEVDNQDDALHPGEFVQVEFLIGSDEVVLAVPTSSIVTIEGSPVVFKLTKGDKIIAQPVEVGTLSGNWVEIRGGLAEGDEIVVGGAFGLKSEFLKLRGG
jgi:cobalt-zinc-cadmium efflux system membrane fusion protein